MASGHGVPYPNQFGAKLNAKQDDVVRGRSLSQCAVKKRLLARK